MNNKRFQNQVVVIFGGTSGIGLMTAVEFIQQGAQHVIVGGRTQWKWERAKNKLHECFENIIMEEDISSVGNSTIEYIACDVRLQDSVKDFLQYIIDKYGYVNVYFNNAGVQPIHGAGDGGDITQLDIESYLDEDGSIIYRIPYQMEQSTPASGFYETPFATSVVGMFYCLKWEMYHAFNQKSDVAVSIINTSSRNGFNIPSFQRPIYSASKAFICSLTQTIATQAAQRGIKVKRSVRINTIAPGPILTPLEIPLFVNKQNVFEELSPNELNEFETNGSIGVPMGRTGRTDEIASVILFLADYTQSSYITGAIIPVDGGYTASPVI